MQRARRTTTAICATLAAVSGLAWSGSPPRSASDLVSRAEARIGRPLTPMSYAGVARRTTRRAVAVGAGAAAAGAYYYQQRPGCVQVVNSYGQVMWQCP
jgi:hypothetical protein